MPSTLSKRGIFFLVVVVVALWQYGVVRNSSLVSTKKNQQQYIKAFLPTDDDEGYTTEEDMSPDFDVHPSTVVGDDHFIQGWADDDGLRREFNFPPKKNYTKKSSKQRDDDNDYNKETETTIEKNENNTVAGNQTLSNNDAINRTDIISDTNHSVASVPSQINKNTTSTSTEKKNKGTKHSREEFNHDNTEEEEEEEEAIKKRKMEPHLIAWYSAGVFVLLGLPISLYGIVMHLTHYNQPHIQVYIVRILWMVPIYSMESWLCLRYHANAIYIETLRDFYESYVLYSFLQFLIQVLGGEEELILMLKDKSPTRGFHMWGMQYCLRPWLMGQPVSRLEVCSPPARDFTKKTIKDDDSGNDNDDENSKNEAADSTTTAKVMDWETNSSFDAENVTLLSATETAHKKRVQWTSPFFVKCKLGVLQYVLLKFVLSIITMILELSDVYKEGNFTPKGGYLYICILTNLSQCWALYCLILFYFATVTELSPIRPVGKFLSVKAIVFFTWWQSVCISFIYQANLIPHYRGDEPNAQHNWTPEEIAKGLQDYLICIEMFVASFVHIAVFPHKDYLPHAVKARNAQHDQMMQLLRRRRVVGRLHQHNNNNSNNTEPDAASQPPLATQQEQHQTQLDSSSILSPSHQVDINDISEGALIAAIHAREDFNQPQGNKQIANFVEAFVDSTAAIPGDLIQNSAGIIRGEYKSAGKKQTLLHHASTSDSHDLFSLRSQQTNKRFSGRRRKTPKEA